MNFRFSSGISWAKAGGRARTTGGRTGGESDHSQGGCVTGGRGSIQHSTSTLRDQHLTLISRGELVAEYSSFFFFSLVVPHLSCRVSVPPTSLQGFCALRNHLFHSLSGSVSQLFALVGGEGT